MMQASVENYKGGTCGIYPMGWRTILALEADGGRIRGTKDRTGPKYHNVPR